MVAEAEAAFGSGSLSFSTNGGAWMNILKSEASIMTSMTRCRVEELKSIEALQPTSTYC
ncbi:uncharacterized protein G2W53_004503 [Senna tora]|uniref:Uncharacterized protein n=1 Tax=Senna tora TaxID=362788 RepID=A0A835CJE5_9FABA|nr:uncharacterized protein G2W53_004503 [Senna tora]